MKDIKTLRKEVDKALQGKLSGLVKTFNEEREQQLLELTSLYEQLEKYEDEKKKLIATQEAEAKNFIPSQKVLNECALKLQHFEKLIRERKKQIDLIFERLTTLPQFMKDYPFLKMIQG